MSKLVFADIWITDMPNGNKRIEMFNTSFTLAYRSIT